MQVQVLFPAPAKSLENIEFSGLFLCLFALITLYFTLYSIAYNRRNGIPVVDVGDVVECFHPRRNILRLQQAFHLVHTGATFPIMVQTEREHCL